MVGAGWGSLWANYGECRLRVAGKDVEVEDEAELFDDLDTWVAFEWGAGPGRVLDRDREYMAIWRERLPEQQAVWAAAAERVFADVYATTGLLRPWSVSVHDDEEVSQLRAECSLMVWPEGPEPSYGQGSVSVIRRPPKSMTPGHSVLGSGHVRRAYSWPRR